MSFGDELAATLPELRAMAEERMRTIFDIEYDTGAKTRDLATDADVPVRELAFETKGRLKSPGLMLTQGQGGGRVAAESKRELHIPAGSPDPWADPRAKRGVTALVTAIDGSDDPTMLGVRVKLIGPAPGSQTTARRLQVTEVVA